MMNWENFIYWALTALIAWITGAVLSFFPSKVKYANICYLTGIVIFGIFIAGFWFNIERPPFRTMGETRLWYSFFLPLCGFIVFKRYKYSFILSFTTVLSGVFILINLLEPEIHDKTLMPALQSAWFTPHVMIYMLAYAVLGLSFLLSLYQLFKGEKAIASTLKAEDELTRIGWVCLLIGMFLGALWAKQAWGHFWTWDPKETWAAATFLTYALYMHLRITFPLAKKTAQLVQILGFLLLQMCWYGLNLFPALSQGSMHLYN